MDPSYLTPLDRCTTCGKPATQQLNNQRNAKVGVYCDRCAGPAKKRFDLHHEEGS